MTKEEGIGFLTPLVPQGVAIVQVEPATWEAFKTLVLEQLSKPDVDPKYEVAVDQVNTIVDAVRGKP